MAGHISKWYELYELNMEQLTAVTGISWMSNQEGITAPSARATKDILSSLHDKKIILTKEKRNQKPTQQTLPVQFGLK